MPQKKKTARKAAKKPAKSFEETLWDTANKLRGSVESSDWSGATERTRQSYPRGERGGAYQNGGGFVLAKNKKAYSENGERDYRNCLTSALPIAA